jgi:4-hydroxy-2-oxoheptanedioate aldolase
MAEVPGVDMVFFGPCDFSLLAGRSPCDLDDPVVDKAAERVCREARAAGKHFGTLVFHDDQARRMLDRGATFLVMGSDISILRRGLVALADRWHALGLDRATQDSQGQDPCSA